MPWKMDLLGTFLSFCPIVSKNQTLIHIVSVPACLPCAVRVDPFPLLLMGWEGRGQHVSKLVLHAKQLYLMPQHTNPSPYTPYFTFVTTSQSPSQTLGLGGAGLRGWVKPCCNDIIAD